MDNWILLGIGINIAMLVITVVVTVTSLRKIIEITGMSRKLLRS
jgi:hypothetical protein